MDDAAAARRLRALTAYFREARCSSMDEVDETNPLVLSSPYALVRQALDQARALLEHPLETQLKRWMKGEREITFLARKGMDTWLPVRELQYSNLVCYNLLNERTQIVGSVLDAWQVCYRPKLRGGKEIWHIQSLVDRLDGKYFRWDDLAATSVELVDVPADWLLRRSPVGSISTEQRDAMLRHARIRPIDPVSQPLHEYIRKIIRS